MDLVTNGSTGRSDEFIKIHSFDLRVDERVLVLNCAAMSNVGLNEDIGEIANNLR